MPYRSELDRWVNMALQSTGLRVPVMSIHPLSEPFDLFETWFKEAEVKESNDPNAMALATVGPDGMPSVRMVLLKEADQRGFVFYTNYQSRKGEHLLAD